MRTRLMELFQLRKENPHLYDFQLPSFCMAECSSVFAKICFEKKSFGYGEKANQAYERLVNELLQDVSSKSHHRIIYSLELKANHFGNIERILKADYELSPPKGYENRLSGHDALIIGMAIFLADSKGFENVRVITADKRITKVCNSFSVFPNAINIDETSYRE